MKMQKILKVSLALVVMMALGVYVLNSVVKGTDDLTPAEVKERLQRVYDEAYMKGNVDALDEIYAPDVVRHELNSPDIIGLDAIKEEIKIIRPIFSECRLMLGEPLISGDRRATAWTSEGTYARETKGKLVFQNNKTGESETISASIPAGTKYNQKGCTINRLVNGKIAEQWIYSDRIVPRLTAAGIELKMGLVEE